MGAALLPLVFQPPVPSYAHSLSALLWLTTKSNIRIPAIHIYRQAKVTLIFSHANAEDLGMVAEWLTFVAEELRVNVLAYDYPGYGLAGGQCNEEACYEAIDAAYTFVSQQAGALPANIVLYGRSLGTGPSLYLAERLSKDGVAIGGVILQSPFLSIVRIAVPLRHTAFFDLFPNVDRAPALLCPVFAIHGTRDEVVPFAHGEQMFLAVPIHLRARPFWIDGGGHNDLETFLRDEMLFIEPTREFLLEWVPAFATAYFAHRDARNQRRQQPTPAVRGASDHGKAISLLDLCS